MTDSLQTDNRSALQVAIEQAVDQELARIEQQAPLPGLFDATESPSQFLVSLAIERGIVDWSESDSESARRMTVRDAMTLHRLSCSREGIRRSIAALGFHSQIQRSRAYVLSVEAEIETEPLTEPLLQRITRRIATYKAGRDSIDLSLVRSSPVNVCIAALAESGAMSDCEAYRPDESLFSDPVYFGVVPVSAVVSDCEPYNIAFSDPVDIITHMQRVATSACYVISDTEAGA